MFNNFVMSSSVKSVKNSQISILAIFEIILASSISLYIFISYNIISHIIIGFGISFFFFLQTPESKSKGLKYIDKIVPEVIVILGISIFLLLIIFYNYIIPTDIVNFFNITVNNYQDNIRIILIFLVLFLMIISYKDKIYQNRFFDLIMRILVVIFLPPFLTVIIGFLGVSAFVTVITILFFSIVIVLFIRSIATIKTLSKKSFLSIPENWVKSIFFTDSLYPPEILPGISTTHHWLSYSNYKKRLMPRFLNFSIKFHPMEKKYILYKHKFPSYNTLSFN